MKLNRQCPRCSARKMQWVAEYLEGREAIFRCVECGHEWKGRILRRDLTDIELSAAKPGSCPL